MSFAASLEQAESSTVAWLAAAVIGLALVAICAAAILAFAAASTSALTIVAVLVLLRPPR